MIIIQKEKLLTLRKIKKFEKYFERFLNYLFQPGASVNQLGTHRVSIFYVKSIIRYSPPTRNKFLGIRSTRLHDPNLRGKWTLYKEPFGITSKFGIFLSVLLVFRLRRRGYVRGPLQSIQILRSTGGEGRGQYTT